MIPRATYRVQFSREFTFDDAAKIVPYLQSLGISHLYGSPWLTARPGSSHRYDVVDHGRIDPELGGEAGFARLCDALQQGNLGQILDFVPNHMGVGGADNAIWLDVLEWGPASEYARWFDIDWNAPEPLRAKVLVPFLGGQYGVELESGVFDLRFDESDGSFSVWAYDTHRLPVCPVDYGMILDVGNADLERLADAFEHLREPAESHGLKQQLKTLCVENDTARALIEHSLATFRGQSGDWDSWQQLDRLIQRQHWRPAHFRVAADDINYRRFFNINELAGIRMEDPKVFASTHRVILELVKAGMLQGLRIDHIDGLKNSRQYLDRLRSSIAADRDCYIVVEKILAQHETLREDWPVEGSTGYEFATLVTGLLTNSAAEDALDRIYREFTHESRSFAEILRTSKQDVIRNELSGELQTLARLAVRIARQNPRTQDFTEAVVRRAMEEIVASFPVYRTYVDNADHVSKEDERDLHWAFEHARSAALDIDSTVFDFLQQLLSGTLVARPGSGYSHSDVFDCAMRFQQYTGPVMAKGLEDTALYRYGRLLALNEVGSRPDQFGVTVATFHKANIVRQKHWPHSMLTLSTHDTKFGEDVRARLVVLSEIPEEWERQVRAWSRIIRAAAGDVEATAPPFPADEYFFYQLLVGSWPAELLGQPDLDESILAGFSQRIREAMIKVLREGKVRSSWTAPNASYETPVLNFIERALDPRRSQAFLTQFRTFVERIAPAGFQNSLVQTALKLTCPGVPDTYQGSELWNFSLMDPDNRRAVSFDRLADLAHNENAHPKLAIVQKLLRERSRNPELFSDGTYSALQAEGPQSEHVVAFERAHAGDRAIVVCTRFPLTIENLDWGDTLIPVTSDFSGINVLTGENVCDRNGTLYARDVFAELPMAVLIST